MQDWSENIERPILEVLPELEVKKSCFFLNFYSKLSILSSVNK